ncbi:transaldolase [Campylobacterota bacterium]|nr:transaldolase [Campylobacterota bacterium]
MARKPYSLWVDYLEREFIANSLEGYIVRGVKGITTNPAIFHAAFTKSKAYETQKTEARRRGLKAKLLYEELAISDVQLAADKLQNIYDGTNGFVSIEVDPTFAHDAIATIEEAKRLCKLIDRENVMIKVPATEAGVIAIKELVKLGFAINATLVFSLDQTRRVLRAVSGATNAVVISVFVSRFDREIDGKLPPKLRYKTGIMNAFLHYHKVEEANNPFVRTLFASTGVKGGDLEADYYLSNLALENAVNTAPLTALDLFLQRPTEAVKLPSVAECEEFFAVIKEHEIDYDKLCKKLLDDALAQFTQAFADILHTI